VDNRAKSSAAFVPLRTLRKGTPTPRAALAEIRAIYFNTTRESIERDLLHAIELIKSIPTEEQREKAAVYMDGLAEMRREWATETARAARKARPTPRRKR
jgi:hypothetical protein